MGSLTATESSASGKWLKTARCRRPPSVPLSPKRPSRASCSPRVRSRAHSFLFALSGIAGAPRPCRARWCPRRASPGDAPAFRGSAPADANAVPRETGLHQECERRVRASGLRNSYVRGKGLDICLHKSRHGVGVERKSQQHYIGCDKGFDGAVEASSRARWSTSGVFPPPRTQPSATRASIFIELERSPRGEPLSNKSDFIGYLLCERFADRGEYHSGFHIARHPPPHRRCDLNIFGVAAAARAQQKRRTSGNGHSARDGASRRLRRQNRGGSEGSSGRRRA